MDQEFIMLKTLFLSVFFFSFVGLSAAENRLAKLAVENTNSYKSIVSNYSYNARIYFQPRSNISTPYIGTNFVNDQILDLYFLRHPNPEISKLYREYKGEQIAANIFVMTGLLGMGGVIGGTAGALGSGKQVTSEFNIVFWSFVVGGLIVDIVGLSFAGSASKKINKAIELNNQSLDLNLMYKTSFRFELNKSGFAFRF